MYLPAANCFEMCKSAADAELILNVIFSPKNAEKVMDHPRTDL
jgi:hypothetical protein